MAIPANYYQMVRSTVTNQRTGYRNRAYLAPASWFTILGEPTALSADGARKTVTVDHTFPVGKGFIEVYVLPESVEAPGESAGEEGALHMLWKPKFFIPGDNAAQQNTIEEQFLNDDLVLLLEDATCPDGGVRQFGCDCTPLLITKANFSSGTKSAGRKGWEIETSTSCRYFYEGVITKAA